MPERHSMRKSCPLLLVLAFLGFSYPAWGQEVTADITGSVVDPTGASIVGANITAKDTERQTAYTVLTNTAGIFHIPRIPVGTYELKVGAPGFQTAIYRGITLVLNQTARVDFQLQLGLASETVEVSRFLPCCIPIQRSSAPLSTRTPTLISHCSRATTFSWPCSRPAACIPILKR